MSAVLERPAVELLDARTELLPLDSIVPSTTHTQTLRRQRYDPEKLLELAASIKTSGLLQPILVRPWSGSHVTNSKGATPKYELVAGERRYLAAQRAGYAHIAAHIRDLTDAQVIEAQLVENLQRDDLQALEEAEGYKELMTLKGIDADEVAHLIGKSRSYVYARRKLLDLCPAAREALQAGKLDASKALLLARIKGEKLQAKALKLVTEQGDWYSYRRLVEKLREDFMIPIGSAPFTIDQDGLMTRKGLTLPACIDCPQFSRNDAELLREIDHADVCTDRACFEQKCGAVYALRRADAEAAGRAILTGDEAAAIIPGQYDGGIKNGYVALDEPCADVDFPEPEPKQEKDESDDAFQVRSDAWYDRMGAWTPPTYRQAMGGEVPPETVLAQAKNGRLVELAPVKAARKALTQAGIKLEHWRWNAKQQDAKSAEDRAENQERQTAERARELERQRVEEAFRLRLFREIHARWKGPLKRPDLDRIYEHMLESGCNWDPIEAVHDGTPKPAKLKDDELLRLIVEISVAHEVDAYEKPSGLLELAQRFKIDAKKIRSEVVAELKPVSVPAQSDAKKPGKKKAAKKTAKK
ncbi:MAG TPA: ParB/RepB/Spo0J family partition protein [Burkholderiales bacterium]|nr:ParB/RepB/Spo0J family partition protein [Burkholderiales bacterium]